MYNSVRGRPMATRTCGSLSWNDSAGHRPPHIHNLRPEVGMGISYPRCAFQMRLSNKRRLGIYTCEM